MPKPKLVFSLLVQILICIVTYFLTVLLLDLVKILLFLELLILFFDFNSINTSGEGFGISATWSKALTIIFAFFLIFIREQITGHRYTRLNIGQLDIFFIFISRELGSSWSLVFCNWPLALITAKINVSNTRDRLQTGFCFSFNSFFEYFVLKV